MESSQFAWAKPIKKLTLQFPGLSRSLGIIVSYAAWILLVRFLSLTFITYFVLSSPGGQEGSRFEEINEAMSSSEMAIFALAAATFILLERLFSIKEKAYEGLIDPERMKKQFIPSFMHGAVLATGVTLAFLIGGVYRYVGFFVQPENVVLAAIAVVVRTSSLLVLVYCEERIFRQKILQEIIRKRPVGLQAEDRRKSYQRIRFWHDSGAIAFTGLLYVGIKALQFDLSWMQAATLFLIAASLGYRSLPLRATKNGAERSYVLAAGYWAALLVVFHVVFSLPVLGHEFSGLVLIRYQPSIANLGANLGANVGANVGAGVATGVAESAVFWQQESTYADTIRFLTGGAGGPLSSFAFQALVALEVFRAALRYLRKNG